MTSFIKSGKIIEYKGNVKNMQICIIRGVNAYILSLLNTFTCMFTCTCMWYLCLPVGDRAVFRREQYTIWPNICEHPLPFNRFRYSSNSSGNIMWHTMTYTTFLQQFDEGAVLNNTFVPKAKNLQKT